MEETDWDVKQGSIYMDIRNSNWPTIVSFAGLGDQFQFKATLANLDVNIIYLRDLKHNWYVNGVVGVGDDVEGVAGFLRARLKELGTSKVITMGASAGGFAAILYGSLLGVHRIIAFSPQTFMDRFHRTIYYDYRWKDRFQQIYAGNRSNRPFLDLKRIVRNYKGKVALFYDKKHRLDNIHARRIKGRNIECFPSAGGGHNLVKELRSVGKLEEYLEEVIK